MLKPAFCIVKVDNSCNRLQNFATYLRGLFAFLSVDERDGRSEKEV
jgi:hypothetical protein